MNPRLIEVHPVLPSSDVSRSVRFYQGLGFELIWPESTTDANYAAVRRDAVELHLQWHALAARDDREDRPVFRFLVEDVDGLYEQVRGAISPANLKPPTDTSWGTHEFHARDPDRNGLQFYQPRET